MLAAAVCIYICVSAVTACFCACVFHVYIFYFRKSAASSKCCGWWWYDQIKDVARGEEEKAEKEGCMGRVLAMDILVRSIIREWPQGLSVRCIDWSSFLNA